MVGRLFQWKPSLSLIGVLVLTGGSHETLAQSHAEPPAGVVTVCPDNGRNFTYATAIRMDRHGNTYVTGGKRLNDRAAGVELGSTISTIKYDVDGSELWSASEQGSFGCFDHGRAITTDLRGNVYVTGTVWLSGIDPTDPSIDRSQYAYVTIKYDKDGVRQWLSQYFTPGDQKNEAQAIALDGHGDVYVTGLSIRGKTPADTEIATVKYHGQTGKQLWAVRYAGSYGILSVGGMAISSNALYVAGTACTQVTQEGTCADFVYEVLKYASTGWLDWSVQYENGVTFASRASSLATDRDGNVYVTGTSCSTPYMVIESGDNVHVGCDYADYATVKLTASGSMVWVSRYRGSAPGNYVPEAIATDDKGNVYVTGSGPPADGGFHTIKYGREGTQSWDSVFEGSKFATPHSVAVTSHGQVYVAGLVITPDSKGYFSVVAYGADGNEIWNHQTLGSVDPSRIWTATAVAIDPEDHCARQVPLDGLRAGVMSRQGANCARVTVTGGTLDSLEFGLVDSWYLTNSYSVRGHLLWTREF